MKHLTITLLILLMSMGAWAEGIMTFKCPYDWQGKNGSTAVYIIDFDQGIALKRWTILDSNEGQIADEKTNVKFVSSAEEINFEREVMVSNGGCVINERIFRKDLSYKQIWRCKYDGMDEFDLDWSGQCEMTKRLTR